VPPILKFVLRYNQKERPVIADFRDNRASVSIQNDSVSALTRGLLTSLDAVIHANLVGDRAAAGSDGAADQRSFATAYQAANHGSSDCRAGDDLGSGVVPMVVTPLGVNRLAMRLLRSSGGRQGQQTHEHAQRQERQNDLFKLHLRSSFFPTCWLDARETRCRGELSGKLPLRLRV
jgi:hypothetical protein